MDAYKGNRTVGETIQTFWGLLDTGSELTLIWGTPRNIVALQLKREILEVSCLMESGSQEAQVVSELILWFFFLVP